MVGNRFTHQLAVVEDITTSELTSIAVENFYVMISSRYTDSIVLTGNWCEIANNNQYVFWGDTLS